MNDVLNDLIDIWHETSNPAISMMSLHSFLGFTKDEYASFLISKLDTSKKIESLKEYFNDIKITEEKYEEYIMSKHEDLIEKFVDECTTQQDNITFSANALKLFCAELLNYIDQHNVPDITVKNLYAINEARREITFSLINELNQCSGSTLPTKLKLINTLANFIVDGKIKT